ncbi:MAG TPA: ABC transporter permease subunit [Gemmatimonadales bacterium]|nr:ABC transporter permease subunit [Gemmatimonadales bacterium]
MSPRRIPIAALLAALPTLVGVGYAAGAATGLIGFGAAGFSLRRVASVLGELTVWRGVAWTLTTAAAATLLATAGAVLVATVFRGTARGDRAARALAVLPLVVPHLVAAAVFVFLFGQSGFLARAIHAAGVADAQGVVPTLVYDPLGIGFILALAWKELPFLSLLAFSVLSTRGPELEETARSLGADRRDVFRRVTWPILWRGLLPGVVAVFAFVAGSYEAAILLAPSEPVALPLLTWERYTDPDLARRADAFVLVLVGIGLAAIAVAVHEWARARWERFEG